MTLVAWIDETMGNSVGREGRGSIFLLRACQWLRRRRSYPGFLDQVPESLAVNAAVARHEVSRAASLGQGSVEIGDAAVSIDITELGDN